MDKLNFDHVCLEPDEVEYVIYHGNCSDGFTSALAAKKYFEKYYPEKQLMYHPGVFDRLPPMEEVKDKCVLITDFSYKKDLLAKLMLYVKKLLILDHHKSAMEELISLPEENKLFTMDHSGAYITWRYFFRDEAVPLMVKYVQDNDIWLKEMEYTYEVTAYIYSLPFTFEAYEKLLDDDYVMGEVISQGAGMVKQNNAIIATAVKYAAPKFIHIGDKYYFAGFLNATTLKSELGNRIMMEYPNVNFSAIYSHNDYNNTTSFSLRSVKTATDVSYIAKIFGGGGHQMASGLLINAITNTLPVEIVDGYKTYHVLKNVYRRKFSMLNVVYLNSAHHAYQLAKYLMQVRYMTKAGEMVQECASILKTFDKFDMSAVWNYDGVNDCTWFTGCVDPAERENIIGKLKSLQNLKSFEEGKDKFVLSVEGCVFNL
ncbi:MAG: DHH family phosphohydrolase [Harvfovirus sp.]|uniref:DHH family phosphohydrolase n=1 Tax=Harvfovirus sp. TaxID=2487768 RepID=A0A3G5A5C1_9VIRU|nr:MAG: DHH family phosphohydrolase [Harvfovirus sp.]